MTSEDRWLREIGVAAFDADIEGPAMGIPRPKQHRHRKARESGPWGYGGPVADDPRRQDPRAHGCVMYRHVCRCGASREMLMNGAFREYGPWTDGPAGSSKQD